MFFNFLSYAKHILYLIFFGNISAYSVFTRSEDTLLKGFSFFRNKQVDEYTERSRENVDSVDSESNEIYRFELLRNELIELEKRVQGSTDESVKEEVSK